MEVPVFVCYAHDDERWLEELREHLQPQVRQGSITVWCDQHLHYGDRWHEEIQRQLQAARVVVVLISPALFASDYIARSELPLLRQRAAAKDGLRVIPLFVEPSLADQAEFRWLLDIQGSPPAKTLSEMSRAKRNRTYVRVAEEIRQICRGSLPAAECRIEIQHLPLASRYLIGRDDELARLDAAWANEHEHILSVVARGGEGKTNLILHWLNRMSADGWRGAARVFATSFYSQGTRERAADADKFLYDALEFFGEAELARFKTSQDLAERLATLVAAGRNLLVLDGLEPLQHPLGGRLRDPALQTLLARLAAYNNGLVVITTRLALPELAAGVTTVTPEIELRPLTEKAGAQLMAALGVGGSAPDRRTVARRLGGHALSIQLMGTFLHNVYNGDVRRASEVALLDQETEDRRKAWNILHSYENWMTEAGPAGPRMLAILRLLGLFDRPAERALIDVLTATPIEGLTEPLAGISRTAWREALARLRELKLLNESSDEPEVLDAHPLIREYFAERLAADLPAAAHEAHSRLFRHLQQAAPPFPEDPRSMTPLYHAIRHGCKAGRHGEAWELYWQRVVQQTVAFTRRKITDQQLFLASNLTALSSFYTDGTFTQLASPSIAGEAKAKISYEAGHHLFVSGRLRDALAPLTAAVAAEAEAAASDPSRWDYAYLDARLLREAYLYTGDLGLALRSAEECLDYAERSKHPWQRMGAWTSLAQVLDFLDLRDDAQACFAHAERLEQTEVEDPQPYLVYVWGFWYADFRLRLLLEACESDAPPARAEVEAALDDLTRRANVALELARQKEIALDQAHAQQLLGRVEALRARFASGSELAHADSRLNEAVQAFRRISHQHHRIGALLDRAAIRRQAGRLEKALDDVREADAIAETGSMIVLRIDAALERCRIALAEGDRRTAAAELSRASEWIEKTKHVHACYRTPPAHHAPDVVRYRRRDAAIAVLRRGIENSSHRPSICE